ncbi:MAG: hypothetical protein M3Q36_04170 [bacterium]|nr:hypothetical protein [bacterium]
MNDQGHEAMYPPDMDGSDILLQLYRRAIRRDWFVYERFSGKDKRMARVGNAVLLGAYQLATPYDLEITMLITNSSLGIGETREEAVREAMDRWEFQRHSV